MKILNKISSKKTIESFKRFFFKVQKWICKKSARYFLRTQDAVYLKSNFKLKIF